MRSRQFSQSFRLRTQSDRADFNVSNGHAIMVVDLAFGDCGKGTIVDYLARQTNAHTVVRFNGGPQAAHNVQTVDGRHHTFSHFGSATFVPGVRTFLSRFMLIEPYSLFNEEAHLRQVGVNDGLSRLSIDGRCVIITPAHQAANRLRELARGTAAHGTCGMGIGETVHDSLDHPNLMIRASDMCNTTNVAAKLHAVCHLKIRQLDAVIARIGDEPRARFSAQTLLDRSWIDVAVRTYKRLSSDARILHPDMSRAVLNGPGTYIYEGAQGVLLDESFGFAPHTTWSNTTFANATTLMDEAAFAGRRSRVGVLRTYFTRHGPGPFVSERDSMRSVLTELHNDDAGWPGRFRVGTFDAIAANYSMKVAGSVDFLAMTHLDRLPLLPRDICTAYQVGRHLTGEPDLRDYFVFNEDRINGICLRRPVDLVHQTRLCELLGKCRPISRNAPTESAEAFCNAIGEELGAEVAIASFGPRACDKRMTQSDWLGT